MNREELVLKAAAKTNLPINTTKKVVDAVFDTVVETLTDGESIKIFRIFNLVPVRRAAHQIRNAQSGELKTIPEHTVIKFKAHNSLRDKMKNVTPKEESPRQPDADEDEE